MKNLWVLSGSDVDQRCWASEGLGRSAFVHYIIEALRGKAAGSDGRLTLDELHGYVLKNVRNWAWDARGAIQEPVLLPRDGQARGKNAAAPARRSPAEVYLASVDVAPSLSAPQPLDRPAWRSHGGASWSSTGWNPTPRPTLHEGGANIEQRLSAGKS